jgi:DNA invertase Pin-like site-specific DNA recombinase
LCVNIPEDIDKMARLYHLPGVKTQAFAYLRTSSATNVGADKDSEKRQLAAIRAFARRSGFEIVGEYYDPAVNGSDRVHERPAFAAMLAAIAGNGVRTIIVETASRFARDLIVQETGYQYMRDLGIALIAADDPDAFTGDTPTQVLIRQILGAVSQFQKAELVAKLAGARARKRASDPAYREGRAPAPDAAKALARRLKRRGLSLRAIATKLADHGFLAPSGKPYGAQSVKVMLSGRQKSGRRYKRGATAS